MRRSSRTLIAVTAILLLAACAARADRRWSRAEMVGPNDSPDSEFPNVEVTPDGTVWIVWSAGSSVFYVTVKDFVQSPRLMVHEQNTCTDYWPNMSMGSDGVPWVVWRRGGAPSGDVLVVSHRTGEGWSPADTVMTSGWPFSPPVIHAANSSDVWVAVERMVAAPSDGQIFLRHWDGTRWDDIQRMGFPRDTDDSPALATDDAGLTWLTWMRTNYGRYLGLLYASSRWDAVWHEPVVADSGACDMSVDDMSMLPDGRPVVIWQGNGNQAAGDLEYAVFDEGAWEYGGLVNKPDNPGDDDDGLGRLGRIPGKELWVTWGSHFNHAGTSYITASRWTGGGWSDEEVVSVPEIADALWDRRPAVAVAPDGRVWAAWERQQQTSPYDTDIYVAYRNILPPDGALGPVPVSAPAAGR
jgi:hypothetical protein